MKLGGFEPGPIFPKVVEIRARKNLRVAVARDAAIEIGLAEEAAINRIGQIAFVGKFARVHNSQPPTLVRCKPFHALSCLFRHGRRDGMESFDTRTCRAMGKSRQGNTVHAAADGDRQRPLHDRQNRGQSRLSTAARLVGLYF